MKIKTSELTGVALDWAVAVCEGGTGFMYDTVATYWININGTDRALGKCGWSDEQRFAPSSEWLYGGPIIERAKIGVYPSEALAGAWAARNLELPHIYGHTPLIAAMRCYVASKFGDEVDVPEALV